MTHLEMKRFEVWLNTENAKRLDQGKSVIEHFYPYEFVKDRLGTSSGDVGSQTNGTYGSLSGDLVRFIFLRASEEELDELVFEKQDVTMRVRLFYYLDTDGSKAVVPDKMMQDFFDACLRYRGHFELTPPIDGIEAMDRVVIKSGPFAGCQASVVRARHSKGSLHLELVIEMVTGVMNILMSDVSKEQVVILNRSAVDAIRTDFIEYTQNHLLTILEHRVKRVADETVKQQDAAMLMRLFRYRNHHVVSEAARNHFLALMLICAHLCRSTAEEQTLKEKVLESLEVISQKSESKAATDARTYLWIALYIVTRDPSYRDAIKKYMSDYQPKSPKLRRFVALIRKGKKV